ncbi:MAG TPA: Hpt domain-containing protein [Myxococcota bacterium]
MSLDFAHVPIVDDVVIKRLFALRDQVARPGEDVLGELLVLFDRDSKARVSTLRDSAIAAERKNAAHALKGAAGNVGAARVAAMAAHVEKNPAVGACDSALIDALEAEIKAAIVALAARMTGPY